MKESKKIRNQDVLNIANVPNARFSLKESVLVSRQNLKLSIAASIASLWFVSVTELPILREAW